MTTTTPDVGFAGLGRMGRPMAHQLVDAGFSVTVYNRTSSVTDAFAVSPRLQPLPRHAHWVNVAR